MMELFGGWRRKVGCLTLMMALVFMGGWIRSLSVSDQIYWVIFGRSEMLTSVTGKVEWASWPNALSDRPQWYTFKVNQMLGGRLVDPEWLIRIEKRWNHDKPGRAIVFPYRTIVLPLTLISAFLLLTQPRQSNQKKITEPIPDEGA